MIKKLLLSILVIFCFALVGVSSANAASWTSDNIDARSTSVTELDLSSAGFDGSFSPKYVSVELVNSYPQSNEISLQSFYTNNQWQYNANLYLYGGSGVGATSSHCFSSPVSDYSFGYRKQGIGTSIVFKVTLSDVCPSFSGITPSGTLNITENGTFDVTNYASAVVDIDPVVEVIEDPISNDFQKVFFVIVEKIIPAFGILLVVWFGIDMLSSLIFGRGR